MRANYSSEPPRLQNQNNGSWLYNYDITSNVVTDTMTGEQRTEWNCSQVTIWGEVTKSKIKTAVIVAEFAPDDEKKLINDYNAHQEGTLTEEKYKTNYLAFLARRKAIKDMVDCDDCILINS